MSWLAVFHPRPLEPQPGPDGKLPAGPPPLTWMVALGLLGAVLGSLLSNVNTRVTTFAVADLRGAFGYNVDESSWVTEAYNVAQIAIIPLTPWLTNILSPRRAIAAAVALQTLASVSAPIAPDYTVLVVLRFLQGAGGGALIPLLLLSVLRFLPSYQRIWGFAVYALVTTVTPLASETLSGELTEYVGWQAIFWENLIPGALIVFLVLVGLPVEKPKPEVFAKTDYLSMVLAVLFTAAITVALGEGQRLDWFDSGLITGLFIAAGVLLAVFLWHSLSTPNPLMDVRLLKRNNLACGLLMIFAFTFATLGTSYVLPQFGAQIRGFRELQVGEVLIGLTLTQFVLCPVAAALLRVVDARLLLTFGLGMATIGYRLATYVTSDWIRGEFLVPLLVQACGLPFIMVPLLIVTTSTLQPQDAMSGGALFNILRTLAGTLGTAVLGAIVTVRERVHSNVIVEHVVAGAQATVQREAGGSGAVAAAATQQAFVMAYADAFGWLGIITMSALVIVMFIRDTRVSYPPKSRPRDPEPAGQAKAAAS